MAITTQDSLEIMKDLVFKNQKFDETLGYLWGRWQDEKDYEDINEYGEVIKKFMPENCSFVRMYKSPFGFSMLVNGETWRVKVLAKTTQVQRVK